MTLFNPLMKWKTINADLPRIGKGGGGGGSKKKRQQPKAVINPKYQSSYPELAGKSYDSIAEMKAAETKIDQQKAAKQAGTNASQYASQFENDYASALKGSADNLATMNLELQQLQQQDQTNPQIKKLVEEKQKQIENAQKEAQTFQKAQATQTQVSQANLAQQAYNDPNSVIKKADVDQIDANPNQFINPNTGKVGGIANQTAATGSTSQAAAPNPFKAVGYDADQVSGDVAKATQQNKAAQGTVSHQMQGAQGQLSPDAIAKALGVDPKFIQQVMAQTRTVDDNELIEGATLDPDEIPEADAAQSSWQSMLKAAQGRVGANELMNAKDIIGAEKAISAVAATAEQLNEMAIMQAAQGTLSDSSNAEVVQAKVKAEATMQGQMADLMKQFDDGTPAWAAGAMRAANAAMQARGLGASSMAGAAITQAAMESAMPIAQQDAQVFAQMGMANADRRQQVALANAAASQNMDLANLNNRQQAALANSANSFALQQQNLSHQQATVIANAQFKAALQDKKLDIRTQSAMANAAKFAEMNQINLNNRQQAALQRSAESLQVETLNLNNRQQTALANAQIKAAIKGQELSNKQQAAVLNAEKFAEAANMTFTAEQQAALHNSNLMQTIGVQEMNAKNAAILANAASVAQMDMANLNNRQQARVQNAQSFLQMDMANLSNRQQTSLFNTQARIDAMLSDQAATNASQQFNASSENQTNQFMAQLTSQTRQFNAAQRNAMSQFNAGETNAMKQFNTQIRNQRDQFNAQNGLIIAQANAKWRQDMSTLNTAAQNTANMEYAKQVNGLTTKALDQLWQRERDLMAFAFEGSENAKDRKVQMALADKQIDAQKDAADSEGKGYLIGRLLFG